MLAVESFFDKCVKKETIKHPDCSLMQMVNVIFLTMHQVFPAFIHAPVEA